MRMIQLATSMRPVEGQCRADWSMAGSGCWGIRQSSNRFQQHTRRIRPLVSPSRGSWRWVRCRTQKTRESWGFVENQQW